MLFLHHLSQIEALNHHMRLLRRACRRAPTPLGWHAARRGLGSNLYRLGVTDMVIQRILRHANVSTTATYYIKTAADDVPSAMTKLENQIAKSGQTLTDTFGTLNGQPSGGTSTVQ